MQIESPGGQAGFAYKATANATVDVTLCVENNTLAQATVLVLEADKLRGALADPAADTKCVFWTAVDFIGEWGRIMAPGMCVSRQAWSPPSQSSGWWGLKHLVAYLWLQLVFRTSWRCPILTLCELPCP